MHRATAVVYISSARAKRINMSSAVLNHRRYRWPVHFNLPLYTTSLVCIMVFVYELINGVSGSIKIRRLSLNRLLTLLARRFQFSPLDIPSYLYFVKKENSSESTVRLLQRELLSLNTLFTRLVSRENTLQTSNFNEIKLTALSRLNVNFLESGDTSLLYRKCHALIVVT